MEIKSGMEIQFRSQPPITHEQLKAYADSSGDFNPIHLDENVAKKAGLPGVIAHGMLSAAFLAERARVFVREEQGCPMKMVRFQARFKAMTFPGDVISVGGVVKEASASQLVLELQAKNQKGETTTTASVVFQ